MFDSLASAAWLWVPCTLFAAAAQTVRNAAQRTLTDEVGALSATLVRFLFGIFQARTRSGFKLNSHFSGV